MTERAGRAGGEINIEYTRRFLLELLQKRLRASGVTLTSRQKLQVKKFIENIDLITTRSEALEALLADIDQENKILLALQQIGTTVLAYPFLHMVAGCFAQWDGRARICVFGKNPKRAMKTLRHEGSHAIDRLMYLLNLFTPEELRKYEHSQDHAYYNNGRMLLLSALSIETSAGITLMGLAQKYDQMTVDVLLILFALANVGNFVTYLGYYFNSAEVRARGEEKGS